MGQRDCRLGLAPNRRVDVNDQFFQFPFPAVIRYQYVSSDYDGALAAVPLQG
jgi:hypothetical protein